MPYARKITLTLFAAQGLGSAGFIAAATIAALVGAELSGVAAWAGVPSATFLLGSALAAYLWGLAMDALGRRGGLALGLLTGVVGAAIASAAVVTASFALLLLGLVFMGSAHAALQLGRFVAAEVEAPLRRGRAVANVVLGGTVGAIMGPLMVGPMGLWAMRLGLPELSGPYLASLAMFALAAAVIFALLRPEPKLLASELSARYPETGLTGGPARALPTLARDPAVMTATLTMVIGQAVMVMLMVITALHMSHHHHPLTSISLVISSHTLGMYAFSVLSGQLADRWGRRPTIALGASTLALASLAATLSPAVLPLAVALFLLGLGWNLLFVGGSSLLSDSLSAAERSRSQGFNDLLIGLSSAAASLGSGVVFATAGYEVMGFLGAALAFIPLALVLRLPRELRATSTEL